MLTVFFSPHATSVDNESARASGHADVPLAQIGRQQARELGQHYATKKLDAVFCSDLQRASTTAEIAFSGRGLPMVLDARLRECDYGELTQCPRDLMEEESLRRITEPFPRGESMSMVVQRVGTFLQDVYDAYNGKTIVVIGHRATRYGLEYWSGDASLAEIVHTPWDWLAVPIWRYEIHAHHLMRRSRELE